MKYFTYEFHVGVDGIPVTVTASGYEAAKTEVTAAYSDGHSMKCVSITEAYITDTPVENPKKD